MAVRPFAGSAERPARLTAVRAQGGISAIGGAVSSGFAGSAPVLALGPQACVLTVATAARRIVRVSGSWSYGSVTAWRVLGEAATGAFAANARLLPNGSLALG